MMEERDDVLVARVVHVFELAGDPGQLCAIVGEVRIEPDREDVPELMNYYRDWMVEHEQLPYRRFSTAAMNRLRNHAWSGNIRELRNVMERAMLIARGQPAVDVVHLPREVQMASGAEAAHHEPRSLTEVERAHIDRTLRAHGHNRTRAAKELGISRATLIKKIREYDLA